MIADLAIRPEEPADRPAIRAIHAAAFGQSAEAALVERLRADGDLVLSLVAVAAKPIGHIAFSPLVLSETPSVKACALAPLAVSPNRQRQGVGSALIKESLRRLAEAGMDLAVVLGDRDYYGRFGFTPDAAIRLKTPYDGPYLQALLLSERGKVAHGPASYARAFADLS
jgi:putative acetyltransferase